MKSDDPIGASAACGAQANAGKRTSVPSTVLPGCDQLAAPVDEAQYPLVPEQWITDATPKGLSGTYTPPPAYPADPTPASAPVLATEPSDTNRFTDVTGADPMVRGP